MRCNAVGRGVALGLALALATPALVQSQTVWRAGPGRRRRSRRPRRLDDGKQARRRRFCRRQQQGLVYGGERDHERGLLSAPRHPQHGGHAVRRHGRVDLRRPRTRRDIAMRSRCRRKTRSSTPSRIRTSAPSPKYRITNTYITDPSRNTLLIRTRFESLDGGVYRLYLLANPSMAGGGANNSAWWDGDELGAHGQRDANPLRLADDDRLGAEGWKSERLRRERQRLCGRWRATATSNCTRTWRSSTNSTAPATAMSSSAARSARVGADTTFTVALGYGGDAASALAAAQGSLAAGFADREAAYRKGWSDYVDGLRPAPASVSTDTLRRRVYYVAAMALHAAEDKTFRGASVAGFATPWGDFVNGDQLNDGYHRVWGRDLYQQATGLIAAGDSAQALRMAQFLWNAQFIGANHAGRRDDVSARRLPALQPRQRDRRGDGQGPRLLRATGRGGFRDPARLDDRPDGQRHLPEDQDDRGSYRGDGAGDDGALGGAVRPIAVVDRGDDRRARRGRGHRPPERRPCERRQLGVDGRFVAFEPRRLDVHDRRILGRSSVL